MVVRVGTLEDVGAFGLAYGTYFLVLLVVRGLAMEPLIVRFGGRGAQLKSRIPGATGTALCLSLVAVPATLCAAWLLDGVLQEAFLALAILWPGLLVQDAWRLVGFAQGQPRASFINDFVLLLAQIAAYLFLWATSSLTLSGLILGWGIAAGVAAGVGVLQFQQAPAPNQALGWLRETRDLGPSFGLDYLVNRTTEQLALVAITVFGGLGVQGVVSAARALFAPFTTVQSGVNAFALPELSSSWNSGARFAVWRASRALAAAMALLMLIGGTVLWLLPRPLGEQLLGTNWSSLREALPAMTVFSALNAAGFGLWLGLRAAQASRSTLLARSVFGIVMVAASAVGASVGDASGAAWAMAIAAGCLAICLGVLLSRRVRHP